MEHLINCIDRASESHSHDVPPGTRRLFAGMLKQVVNDLQKDDRRRKSALKYMNTRNETYLFSFDNCCAFLGIDPEVLREALHQEQTEELPTAA